MKKTWRFDRWFHPRLFYMIKRDSLFYFHKLFLMPKLKRPILLYCVFKISSRRCQFKFEILFNLIKNHKIFKKNSNPFDFQVFKSVHWAVKALTILSCKNRCGKTMLSKWSRNSRFCPGKPQSVRQTASRTLIWSSRFSFKIVLFKFHKIFGLSQD